MADTNLLPLSEREPRWAEAWQAASEWDQCLAWLKFFVHLLENHGETLWPSIAFRIMARCGLRTQYDWHSRLLDGYGHMSAWAADPNVANPMCDLVDACVIELQMSEVLIATIPMADRLGAIASLSDILRDVRSPWVVGSFGLEFGELEMPRRGAKWLASLPTAEGLNAEREAERLAHQIRLAEASAPRAIKDATFSQAVVLILVGSVATSVFGLAADALRSLFPGAF